MGKKIIVYSVAGIIILASVIFMSITNEQKSEDFSNAFVDYQENGEMESDDVITESPSDTLVVLDVHYTEDSNDNTESTDTENNAVEEQLYVYGEVTDEYTSVLDYLISIEFQGSVIAYELNESLLSDGAVFSELVYNSLGKTEYVYLAWNADVSYELVVIDGEIRCDESPEF